MILSRGVGQGLARVFPIFLHFLYFIPQRPFIDLRPRDLLPRYLAPAIFSLHTHMCISKSISFCCVPRQTRNITALAFICIYQRSSFQMARPIYSFLLCVSIYCIRSLYIPYPPSPLLLSSFGLGRSVEERREVFVFQSCIRLLISIPCIGPLHWSVARYHHLYVIIVLNWHMLPLHIMKQNMSVFWFLSCCRGPQVVIDLVLGENRIVIL